MLATRLLAFAHLAADILRGLARAAIDRIAPPRAVDAACIGYRDEVMGDDPPAWVAAVRADMDAEFADRNARNDWRA